MQTRHWACLAALLLMPVLTSCESSGAASPATAQVKATRSAGPLPAAQLTQVTDQALLTASTLSGATQQQQLAVPESAVSGCGKHLKSDADVIETKTNTWSGGKLTITETAVGYHGITATAVVAQAKKLLTSCHHYTTTEYGVISHETITGFFTIDALTGTDAVYTYCDQSKTVTPVSAKGTTTTCIALLARGPVMVSLQVQMKGTGYASRTPLRTLAPQATARLVAAVPTGTTA